MNECEGWVKAGCGRNLTPGSAWDEQIRHWDGSLPSKLLMFTQGPLIIGEQNLNLCCLGH